MWMTVKTKWSMSYTFVRRKKKVKEELDTGCMEDIEKGERSPC